MLHQSLLSEAPHVHVSMFLPHSSPDIEYAVGTGLQTLSIPTMCEPIALVLTKIPANPDISGVGVRTATYTQNIICILSALLALMDGKVTQGKLDYAETQTTTNLILAFAILISSIVQARTLGMSNYHASIVLSMSWMNNTNAFVYFILYVHHKIGLPEGQGRVDIGWKAWMRHVREKLTLNITALNSGDTESVVTSDRAAATDRTSKRSASILIKRFVLVIGSLHLTLMAALGIWLWTDPLSFGHGRRRPLVFGAANKCTMESAVVAILGRGVRLHSEILRIISLIFYGILLIPGLNLVGPMCVFLGLYATWTPASRAISRIRAASQASIEMAERRPYHWSAHGHWCHAMWHARAFPARVGTSLPTSAQLEATPAFFGLAILLAINLVFIIDIELTLGLNRALQDQDEEDWGFGQILAILLLLLPLRDFVETILARRLKQRQDELGEDLQEAIESQSFDRVKRAIERGSVFPSPTSQDQHLKFWNIIYTHKALNYFDDLRRTRMTITEKALEGDLHEAIIAKDTSHITAACNQGADLIAGVLRLSKPQVSSSGMRSMEGTIKLLGFMLGNLVHTSMNKAETEEQP
ncbi:hypothetical protein BKA70DRAFT_24226 [Coprinopsis sp. MPI-PUGE-AT-0042]|nr:hypothetical protein BKA70DRAFT_24226 [Coprinopsis sp. MPI-PUGE-AT-0042]